VQSVTILPVGMSNYTASHGSIITSIKFKTNFITNTISLHFSLADIAISELTNFEENLLLFYMSISSNKRSHSFF